MGCRICLSERRTELLRKDGYPIVRCDDCGLVYAEADVDGQAIAGLYDEAYYRGGLADVLPGRSVYRDYEREGVWRIPWARRRLRRLRRLVPSGRLLDVGCATGFVLDAACGHFEVVGVEPSTYAAEIARSKGHDVINGTLEAAALPDAHFDAVTMFDVIEHVPAPVETLRRAWRLCRPGGVIVVETGNVEGPLASADLESWEALGPPWHLSFFSPQTLRLALERAGFELQTLRVSPLERAASTLVAMLPDRIARQAVLRDLPRRGDLLRPADADVMTVYARRPTASAGAAKLPGLDSNQQPSG